LSRHIYVNEDTPTIAQLLFADDMADTADTVVLIRRQIDVLSDFCQTYAMTVNMQTNPKIMIFRKGGPLRTQEVWYLDGQKIETTSKYKYLGILFTPNLSWWTAQQTLAYQASKALPLLMAFIGKTKFPINRLLFLFDHMVSPILQYGAEIWGWQYSESIERVHLKMCKYIQCTLPPLVLLYWVN
jgi:hypothetical protein